jgi:acyl dehydratase
MPLNLSFAGRSLPPTEPYRVGREKIREFAEAIGATDPEYLDPAAAQALGHPDVIAPPTFPVLITMPVSKIVTDDPDLGMDYLRLVHGDQRFEYVRPVRAGDELICRPTVEKVTSRAGLDSVTIRLEIESVTGDRVVTVWSRLVSKTIDENADGNAGAAVEGAAE